MTIDRDHVVQILRRVSKATNDKALDWESGPEGGWVVNFTRSSVQVLEARDNDGNERVFFTLLNDEGDDVGELDDREFPEIRTLYGMAERQGLAIDETLTDILEGLKQNGY